MMVFHSDSNAKLVQGTEKCPPPEKTTSVLAWDKRDDAALAIIWVCTSEEFLYLVEEETLGSACYAKLKARFETTTFAHHIELRKTFYNAKHNSLKPIKIYIQKVINAKAQLTAMGHTVDDIEVKDVILMNLHSTYDTVKLSLLTQPAEPSLDVIHSILTLSSPIIDALFAVKTEATETALATKFGKGGNDRESGSGNPNLARLYIDAGGEISNCQGAGKGNFFTASTEVGRV